MSFFRYPGGKAKLKDKIVTKLVELSNQTSINQYREPFFGGGVVGIGYLEKHTVDQVWVNDKDIGLSCLWTTVMRCPELLKQQVRCFTPSVEAFYRYKEFLTPLTVDSPIDLLTDSCIYEDTISTVAFKKLAVHQLSYSGLGTKSGGPLGGRLQKSKYKIDCRWSPDYICKKIDKLHLFFKQFNIVNNSCSEVDFEDMLITAGPDTLIYLDPPYFIEGNKLYQEGFTKENHLRLAKSLRGKEFNWVLSYDNCKEIRELYNWADIKTIAVNYSINTARVKEELIITRRV